MPEMDGFEATAAIRAREEGSGCRMPIIAMTAHAMKGDEERCLAGGMDGYVAKPVKMEALAAVIARLIGGPPAPEGSASEGPLDLGAALAIVDGDTALLAELVGRFVSDYPGQLTELREAVRSGDAGRTERGGHRLKGALSALGARVAQDLAAEVETLGREARLGPASAVLEHLERELERIAAFVAQPGWTQRREAGKADR